MKRTTLMNGYTHSAPNRSKDPSTYVPASLHNFNNQYHCSNGDHHQYHNIHDHDYYMTGFPWPPRSYTCSFCRKEFKSAQALGGHMNVHRRDRARLRQSPPPNDHQAQPPMLNLNLDPTINSNHSSSSSSSNATLIKPITCTLPLFVSPTSPSPSPELKRWVVVDGMLLNPLSTKAPDASKIAEYGHAFAREDGCQVLKKGEIVRMDLEIGLPRDYDLDLELRLGTYS
ncbi:hypothetical protein RJT34_29284 [Clitoria ternatea]|uniref:C2H2-type domain-containing protein n=1 Tax=Clitoria ternatea TaxID=43366 RepID=A0AAN9I9K2_CLITE